MCMCMCVRLLCKGVEVSSPDFVRVFLDVWKQSRYVHRYSDFSTSISINRRKIKVKVFISNRPLNIVLVVLVTVDEL